MKLNPKTALFAVVTVIALAIGRDLATKEGSNALLIGLAAGAVVTTSAAALFRSELVMLLRA